MGTRTTAMLAGIILIASVQPVEAQYGLRNDDSVNEWRRMQRENERRWRDSEAETRRLQREQLRQQREYEQLGRQPFGTTRRRY